MIRMMKLLALVAFIAVLFSCGAIALFLSTVYALTREIPVAQVIMSPIQSDSQGEYIEIEYTPYDYPSALVKVVSRNDDDEELGRTQRYKVYGDVVAVRGPLIKLHTGLQLLGYDNVYKLALIEGEYRRRPGQGEGSEFPLEGGFDASWWDFNQQEANYPYNLIVDRFTFAGHEEPGFVGAGKKRYEIVVTMDTITWNFIENLP